MEASKPAGTFSVHLELLNGYEFKVKFDKAQYAELRLDEPPPLGADSAPNAVRLLAAAIGNCLSASLVFCLNKAQVRVDRLQADVRVELERNSERHLRIGRIDVTLSPDLAGSAESVLRCTEVFEDFCTVTQSVRTGIDVRVHMAGSAAMD